MTKYAALFKNSAIDEARVSHDADSLSDDSKDKKECFTLFICCPFCGTFKQNFCRKCMIPLEEDWKICPTCGLQQHENERSNSNDRFHSIG